jgi:hypothetical protein
MPLVHIHTNGSVPGRLFLRAGILFFLFAMSASVPPGPAQSYSSNEAPHQVFRIVYNRETSIPFAMDAPISKNIYALNTDGSAEEKLTEDNHSSAPVLAPDGSQIAYVHIKAETCEGWLIPAEYELYVMNADGTDPHFVAASEEPLPYISWSLCGLETRYPTQPKPLTSNY